MYTTRNNQNKKQNLKMFQMKQNKTGILCVIYRNPAYIIRKDNMQAILANGHFSLLPNQKYKTQK